MTMAIFRDNGIESYDLLEFDGSGVLPTREYKSIAGSVPLVRSKMQPPPIKGSFERKWLNGLLERSARNSAATIVVGRAGSGKTALAASFVKGMKNASWYSLDAGDSDWIAFQRYFRAVIFGRTSGTAKTKKSPPPAENPLELFADITSGLELGSKKWPATIVLDGVHHLFDCDWFEAFFNLMIASLPHDSHAVMLSRSKPPGPIWRLRSKQVLNVIDEKLLAFSQAEAEEVFVANGLPPSDGSAAHRESFGRASKLMEILETRLRFPDRS
ncbi:MAG TPA: hypothetical protein VJL58_07220 [Pyrinomonadaceae bacterium]|nr:hypothetical protein [Pyrinomonadaceae bacterium]